MSDVRHDHAQHDPHAEQDKGLHSHGDTHGRGTRRSYLIGFLLSVVLTAIPFWLVMTGAIADRQVTTVIVVLFAILQIGVHTVCFLHLNSRAEGGWTLLAFIFTLVIVLISICGSLWIMYHLNSNMMPMQPGGMSGQMPEM